MRSEIAKLIKKGACDLRYAVSWILNLDEVAGRSTLAIYHMPPQVCVVKEREGEMLLLECYDGEGAEFWCPLGDPNLVIDPSTPEVEACMGK